jgi:undecaprenyl-diphosphatase
MNLYIVLIVLGIVQGVSEFLPISSSGHLVILEQLETFRAVLAETGDINLLINVTLHVATLIAVVIYMRSEILWMITGFFRGLRERDHWNMETRTIAFILLASLPAALVGLLLRDQIEVLFSSSTSAFAMLILNGIILISTKKIPLRDRQLEETGLVRSIIIGLFQALAIMPGISRSGMTIAGGLINGLKPADSARFSFLMSVPVIAGAGLLEGSKLLGGSYPEEIYAPLALSMVITTIVALFSMKLLFELVKRLRLDIFGYYTIGLGILGLTILYITGTL